MKLLKIAVIAVGAIFVLSAVAKLFPVQVFSLTLQSKLDMTATVAGWVARAIISLEICLGLLLIIPGRGRILGAWLGMVVLASFVVYLALDILANGNVGDCGCFGAWLSFTPLEAIIKNVISGMILGVFLYKMPVSRPSFSRFYLISPFILTFILILIYPISSQNSTTAGNSSPFSQFSHFEDYGPKNLDKGENLVAFLSMDCDHCKEVGRELNAGITAGELPETYLVLLGSEYAKALFFEEIGGKIPSTIASPEIFFSFLESFPPRITLLVNGKVQQNWDSDSFSIHSVQKTLRTSASI